MGDTNNGKISTKHVIISEKPELITVKGPDTIVLRPESYIENDGPVDFRKSENLRVINLCKRYEYLSKGYYCSLLAEARGHRCVPPIDSVVTLNWKRLAQNAKPELNALIVKHCKVPAGPEISKTYLCYFGRSEESGIEPLTRRVFDIFRFPLVSIEIRHVAGQWTVGNIEPVSVEGLAPEKLSFLNQALAFYTGKAWSSPKKPSQEKFWLAILHDPKEKMPPSNKGALEAFLKSAKRHNVFAELITKEDMSSLLEYDALFIRETTSIDHHTYRFAHKAEMEGMVCIDDTASIIRCSNKVFLNEIMAAKHVKVPRTHIVDRQNARKIEKLLDYPFIIKVPDGSFSRGIYKVASPEESNRVFTSLFKQSDILLVQEFLPSDYDWRITLINGEPLFACQYYMAEGHWQIYNHKASGNKKSGKHKTWAVEDVPKEIITEARRAAAMVGNGLYGVDLKQNENGIYVIEVNDNPNIDKGIEDTVLGEKLYDKIIERFVTLVDL